MDNSDGLSGLAEQLSEQELEKLNQFKDLTGIEQKKCLQILRANDWNLEIALDLALDGAYSEDQSIYSHQLNESASDDATHGSNSSSDTTNSNSNSHLRQRHPAAASSSFASTGSSAIIQEVDESRHQRPNEEQQQQQSEGGLHMVLWNSATWLLKIPFIIVINTLNTFYDFFATLIRPTLNYDATGTVDRYVTEFEEKYGTTHPVFHRGTYSGLLDQGKRDIRFIVIYLHSPAHRDTDRFCTNVIATQRFADFIATENILFWSCSVYYPEGYKVFQSLKASSYPFVALVGLKNNRMVAMKKIEGYCELDTFLTVLKSAVANNEYSLIAARVDREERNMATLIRAQQDAAFEESLRADQEKERKKREAEEKKAQEERLQREKEQAETQRLEKVLRLKSSLKDELPAEPEQSQTESIRIMFKLPNGNRLERRFLKSDPVKHLYFYVFTSEESLFNFKLRTNFPTRDLPGYSPSPEADHNSSEMNTPLEQCNLCNNIVLFVHDLDSFSSSS